MGSYEAKKKFVYVLESGGANKDGNYHFYEMEIFSSRKKLDQRIEKSISINKGWDLTKENFYFTPRENEVLLYSYKCMSSENEPNLSREMTVKYKVSKREIL